MKKLLTLALLIGAPLHAATDTGEAWYIGQGFGHAFNSTKFGADVPIVQNSRVRIFHQANDSWDVAYKESDLMSFFVGKNVEDFRYELSLLYSKADFSKMKSTNTLLGKNLNQVIKSAYTEYTNLSGNIYADFNLAKYAKPYIGLGVGVGSFKTKISTKTQYALQDRAAMTSNNLTWQFAIGQRFPLNDKLNVFIEYRKLTTFGNVKAIGDKFRSYAVNVGYIFQL